MNLYILLLQHDKGMIQITINADSEQQAIKQIMNIELCPRSAIKNITKA